MSKRPYTIRGTERFASKPFRKTGTTAGLREAGIEVEATFDEGIDAIPRAMQNHPLRPAVTAPDDLPVIDIHSLGPVWLTPWLDQRWGQVTVPAKEARPERSPRSGGIAREI